ncbi:radical SAM protein [Anaerococcus lactolyticus]|uniref:Radical SAM core domain-containing protein n=1 Tax=Anaerococcus lactolyticus S7-1-13 TaxID=1284686 RepID=A0A095X0M4_9FIRM|nr:radical SAM protein [Anaerococcus lactolyticus]KGF03261.1 hypothetical protein HMPREF1630_08260 [Anaerococcus lactolyticus S7-1-13]
MDTLYVMIKPNSNLCNIDCSYCFYKKNHNNIVDKYNKFLTKRSCVILIKNIILDLSSNNDIQFIFQGGEPSLIGLEFYKFFIDTVNFFNRTLQKNISYNFQTNGINIDEEWALFFKENNFLVGLSLDMYQNNHDLHRTCSGQGTFDFVMKTKRIFDSLGVDYNILSVLTKNLSMHPIDAYKFIKNEQISYVQFIPCIDDNVNDDNIRVSPRDIYNFYSGIVYLWIDDLKNNRIIHIKLFEDIYYFIKNKTIGFCGQNGQCGLQIVVESDLSVYPCDFFCFEKYRLGSLYKNNLSKILLNSKHLCFLNEKIYEEKESYCKNHCGIYSQCGLGCKKLFGKMYLDETGFCAYKNIVKLIRDNYCAIDSAYKLNN